MFAHRLHNDNAVVSLTHNRMRVAECEIVFRLGRPLAPRAGSWMPSLPSTTRTAVSAAEVARAPLSAPLVMVKRLALS